MGLSFAVNMTASTLTTWYLSFTGLITIERNSSKEATDWHIRNNVLVTAVIFASSCRIESLAILRLQLRGKTLSHFPIDDRYFHFLKYSGWFHAILADIPHLTVAVALLLDPSEESDDTWPCGSHILPALSIFFSSVSIVWGFVSRTSQWVVAEVGRRPAGRPGGWDVLRESLLGSSFAMPQDELTDVDVEARWQNAAQSAARQIGPLDGAQGVSRPVSPGAGGSGYQTATSSRHHKRRGDDSEIHVMFVQTHLRELQPASWKQQVIGKGSYGVVYRATWRGQQVAVKELKKSLCPMK